MKYAPNQHPANFTVTRLQFLATQLIGGKANEGDKDEAAWNLAYVATLLEEGKL